MFNYLLVVLVAILCGIAAVVQAQFNGIMQEGMGTLESVFITYGFGGFLILLIMLFRRGGNLQAFGQLPPYVTLAAVCGLIIIGSISYAVPRIGLVTTFTIVVATQFILGAIFDHYGVMGAEVRLMTAQKLIGMGVVMGGVWLIMR